MPGRYTEDDLDGGSADVQVTFALEGQQYEIDLNHRNADALRLALDPYIQAGPKASGRSPRRSSHPVRNSREHLAYVRASARANGHSVSDRGRVPATILDANANAHRSAAARASCALRGQG